MKLCDMSVYVGDYLTVRELIDFFDKFPEECLDWDVCFGGASVEYINVDTENTAFSLDCEGVFENEEMMYPDDDEEDD